MFVAGFLLVLGCIGMIFLSKKLLRSYFAPFGLFNWAWGLSFFLLTVTTLADNPLSKKAWLAILIVWFSFGLGSITVGLAAQLRKKPRRGRETLILSRGKTGLKLPQGYKTTLMLVSLLSIVGALRFDYVVLQGEGVTSWLTNPQRLRHLLTCGSFDTGTLTHVFRGINMVAASMGGVWILRDPKYLPAYFGVLAAAMSDLIFLGRSHTLIVLGIFVGSIYFAYQVEPKKTDVMFLKHLHKFVLSRRFVSFVVIVFFFFFLPFSRISSIRNAPGKYTEGHLNALMPFVINLSQNWYAVDYIVNRDTTFAMGANTFYVPKYVLYRVGLIQRDPRLDRLYYTSVPVALGRPVNTYTMVGTIFEDFGYIGLLILPYLLAVFMNQVYVEYKRRPTLVALYALSFIPSYMIFAVQGDQLSSPPFNFGFIAAITVGLYIQRKNHVLRHLCMHRTGIKSIKSFGMKESHPCKPL